jgi:hypothetical protein
MSKTVNFSITDELHGRFKAAVRQNGVTFTSTMRLFMLAYANGELYFLQGKPLTREAAPSTDKSRAFADLDLLASKDVNLDVKEEEVPDTVLDPANAREVETLDAYGCSTLTGLNKEGQHWTSFLPPLEWGTTLGGQTFQEYLTERRLIAVSRGEYAKIYEPIWITTKANKFVASTPTIRFRVDPTLLVEDELPEEVWKKRLKEKQVKEDNARIY